MKSISVKLRPNPFLEKRLLEKQLISSSPPIPEKSSWFQVARDWTAFIVSLASLLTAFFALRNTLTGPQPFLAQLTGDAITILRSDQFLVGTPPTPGMALRDESGAETDFPLVVVQTTLANRAASPNSIGVRSIESDLIFSNSGQILFRSTYFWYRITTSSATLDKDRKVDKLIFSSAEQVAPFDLAGGSTWSREIMFIPRKTWAAANWDKLADQIIRECSPLLCQGELQLRVRFDSGITLTQPCRFRIDEHMLAHFKGKGRQYFSSPFCEASSGGAQ